MMLGILLQAGPALCSNICILLKLLNNSITFPFEIIILAITARPLLLQEHHPSPILYYFYKMYIFSEHFLPFETKCKSKEFTADSEKI